MNNITIQIRLVKIKECDFNLLTDDKTRKILQIENLQVGINTNIIPSLSNNRIKLQITVDYHYINNAILIKPLSYTMETWFDIINLVHFIEEKDESILINHELLSILLGTSIGTIRGMIAHRCKGTVFENYPLPIINVTYLIANLHNNRNTIENIDVPPIFLSKIH